MKKYILIFSLQLFTFCALAQIDDLLKNKNITWIAEGYQDVATDQSMNHKFGDTLSHVILQKYIKQTIGDEPAESFAPYLLMNAIDAQKITIYEDAACKRQLPQALWGSNDTISTFDPVTFEQKIRIVKANVNYKSVAFFRMYKVFYYDAEATKFGAQVISIAPMQKETNGKNTSYKPMCWIKVRNVSTPEFISNMSICWAAQISLDDSPFFVGNRKNVKILKEVDVEPLKTYFETLKSKTQIPLFAPQQHGFGEKWSSSKRKLSLSDEIRDTISIFNPVTYAETIRYATTKVVFEGLKLVEYWSWDTAKNEFEIAVIATAPLLTTKDEKGQTLFLSPYFYRLQLTDL